MKIVTMADVDAARVKLTEVINDLRRMYADGVMPHLTMPVVTFRDYCEEQVEKLLREYHAQRSPEFLLKMLRHMWECALVFDIDESRCDECEAARFLSKEAA